MALQLAIVYSQRFPYPYQDDFPAILGFALRYTELHGLRQHLLSILLAQHNEYRLIFEHLLVCCELSLTHSVDFTLLGALGNAFPLLIGWALWMLLRLDQEPLTTALYRFLPTSLLIFSLTYWETMDWTMASLQNLPVIFWGLASLYLLNPNARDKQGLRFALACLAAILSAFSSGNGLLLLPVGLVALVPARASRRSVIWCCAFCVPLATYLYHYVPQAHQVKRLAFITRPLFFVAFLGGAVPSRWIATLLGFALLVTLFVFFRGRFAAMIYSGPALCILWLLGTDLLAAWVRGGAGFFVASRYSIYSDLLIACCFFFVSQKWKVNGALHRDRRYIATVAITLLFCLSTDIHGYLKLKARRQMVVRGIAQYRQDPLLNSPMVDPAVEASFPKEKRSEQVLLTESIDKGLYRFPDAEHQKQR